MILFSYISFLSIIPRQSIYYAIFDSVSGTMVRLWYQLVFLGRKNLLLKVWYLLYKTLEFVNKGKIIAAFRLCTKNLTCLHHLYCTLTALIIGAIIFQVVLHSYCCNFLQLNAMVLQNIMHATVYFRWDRRGVFNQISQQFRGAHPQRGTRDGKV